MFPDLAREGGFNTKVLDPDPIKGPWHDAARAILDGGLVPAADIIESTATPHQPRTRGYVRLRRWQLEETNPRLRRNAPKPSPSTSRLALSNAYVITCHRRSARLMLDEADAAY